MKKNIKRLVIVVTVLFIIVVAACGTEVKDDYDEPADLVTEAMINSEVEPNSEVERDTEVIPDSEVELDTEAENTEIECGSVELMQISRADGKIHLRLKFDFGEDISEMKELCESHQQWNMFVKSDGVLINIHDGSIITENCIADADGNVAFIDDGVSCYFGADASWVYREGYEFSMNWRLAVTPDGKLMNMRDGTIITEDCTVSEDGKLAFTVDGKTIEVGAGIEYNHNDLGEILYAPPFANSTIEIDGLNAEILDEEYGFADFPVRNAKISNEEISGNILIQNVVLNLQDDNYQGDIPIAIRYKDIELGNRTIKGEWFLDYTISNADYAVGELKRRSIELSGVVSTGIVEKLYAYSVTPAGVKMYGTSITPDNIVITEENSWVYFEYDVRIRAKDEFGNIYYFYSMLNDDGEEVYSLSDSLGGESWLAEDAKTLTIVLEQVSEGGLDENGNFLGYVGVTLSDELTISIEPQ